MMVQSRGRVRVDPTARAYRLSARRAKKRVVVDVCDSERPEDAPISIHAAYHLTLDLKPAQEIFFKVRAFNFDPTDGQERGDFGDGTPT